MFRELWGFRTDSTPNPNHRHCNNEPGLLRARRLCAAVRSCTGRLLLLQILIAEIVLGSSIPCRGEDPVSIQPSTLRPKSPQLPSIQVSETLAAKGSTIRMTSGPCVNRQHPNSNTLADQPSDLNSGFSIFSPFRRIKERWKQHTRPRWQQLFLGYPEEFREPPLGLFLTAHTDAMIASGERTNSTLFQCDFLTNTEQLNASGIRKLRHIADTLSPASSTIVIESTPQQPQLAELRRAAVATWFASHQFNISGSQIVVRPLAPGGLNSHDIDSLRWQFEAPTTRPNAAR